MGVFEDLGVGAGWSTPSVDFGASSDWIVFRTADNHELEDFAGRASLSNVALGIETVHDSIRFADPDSWLPWIGDIDVQHERAADSILFGDSVDIRDATQHLGIGLSASTVFLDLRATRFEAPAPDLGDVVRDAIEQ